MENGENGTAVAVATAPADSERPPIPAKKRSIFRAVVLAFRSHSSKKAPVSGVIANANAADAVIKTLVGGMRPLHYSLAYQCAAPPPPPPDVVLDAYYDVRTPPSPCPSAPMSRYASAEDLQLLDTSEDNEEEGGSCGGEPNAIDARAEEFIAMFYKQIRLQLLDEEKATVVKSEDLLSTTDEQSADSCKTIEEEKAADAESASEAEVSHEQQEA